jgi:hypothetical protein
VDEFYSSSPGSFTPGAFVVTTPEETITVVVAIDGKMLASWTILRSPYNSFALAPVYEAHFVVGSPGHVLRQPRHNVQTVRTFAETVSINYDPL